MLRLVRKLPDGLVFSSTAYGGIFMTIVVSTINCQNDFEKKLFIFISVIYASCQSPQILLLHEVIFLNTFLFLSTIYTALA